MPYTYIKPGIFGQILHLYFRKNNVHFKKGTGVSPTVRMLSLHLPWNLFDQFKSQRRTRMARTPTAVLLMDIPFFDLVLL
jgi:hypothetical protein